MRLQPGAIGEQYQMPDLAQFPQDKVQLALQKRACVEALRRAKTERPGKVEDWLPALIAELQAQHEKLRISRTTLYAWDKMFRGPADFEKLIDSRGGDQKASGGPEDWKHFKALYLSDRQPSLAECWRQTKLYAEAGGRVFCSKKSCQRQLDRRIPPEVQLYHRQPIKWRSASMPSISQDAERFAAGRCWVGDHTQLDFWVRFGGSIIRPWITVWQDWRTRRIVGWMMSDSPNSDTILAALGVGLKDPVNMGGPNEVVIDNGKDYDCWFFHGQTKQQRQRRLLNAGYVDEGQFRGLFSFLQIEPHFSIAYNPNGKARMERWFGTLHGQFDKSFATYCGGSTATKPESLEAVLKNVGQIPAFEHARQRLGEFIAAFNASADHEMADLAEAAEKLSPDEAMRRWCTTQRAMADENAIDLLCRHWYPPVTVGKAGVTIAPYGFGLHYGFAEPALMPFKAPGKKSKDKPRVLVSFDPQDLRTVHIWDERFNFICTAHENDLGGQRGALGREQCSRLMSAKRSYRKALKAAADGRHFEYLTAAEIIQAGLTEPPAPPAPPKPDHPHALQIVQTPVDDQSKALQRDQVRKAAGAECDAVPDRNFRGRGLPSPSQLGQAFPAFAGFDDPMPLQTDAPEVDDGDEGPASPWSTFNSGGDL